MLTTKQTYFSPKLEIIEIRLEKMIATSDPEVNSANYGYEDNELGTV